MFLLKTVFAVAGFQGTVPGFQGTVPVVFQNLLSDVTIHLSPHGRDTRTTNSPVMASVNGETLSGPIQWTVKSLPGAGTPASGILALGHGGTSLVGVCPKHHFSFFFNLLLQGVPRTHSSCFFPLVCLQMLQSQVPARP